MNIIPDFYFNKVTDITPEFLKSHGIKGVALDIDNTLTFDNQHVLPDEVAQWLAVINEARIAAIVVSNNGEKRSRAFSELCTLPYFSNAHKPSQRSIPIVLDILGAEANETAVIGDQIFTDIWYGKRAKCRTILVNKMGDDVMFGVRLKRVLEKPLMIGLKKKGFTKQ